MYPNGFYNVYEFEVSGQKLRTIGLYNNTRRAAIKASIAMRPKFKLLYRLHIKLKPNRAGGACPQPKEYLK